VLESDIPGASTIPLTATESKYFPFIVNDLYVRRPRVVHKVVLFCSKRVWTPNSGCWENVIEQ